MTKRGATSEHDATPITGTAVSCWAAPPKGIANVAEEGEGPHSPSPAGRRPQSRRAVAGRCAGPGAGGGRAGRPPYCEERRGRGTRSQGAERGQQQLRSGCKARQQQLRSGCKARQQLASASRDGMSEQVLGASWMRKVGAEAKRGSASSSPVDHGHVALARPGVLLRA
jgi:hypothetical protein